MSIIDEIVSIATYYVHYHVISDWNTSVLRYTKPGKWLSGQTSSLLGPDADSHKYAGADSHDSAHQHSGPDSNPGAHGNPGAHRDT